LVYGGFLLQLENVKKSIIDFSQVFFTTVIHRKKPDNIVHIQGENPWMKRSLKMTMTPVFNSPEESVKTWNGGYFSSKNSKLKFEVEFWVEIQVNNWVELLVENWNWC